MLGMHSALGISGCFSFRILLGIIWCKTKFTAITFLYSLCLALENEVTFFLFGWGRPNLGRLSVLWLLGLYLCAMTRCSAIPRYHLLSSCPTSIVWYLQMCLVSGVWWVRQPLSPHFRPLPCRECKWNLIGKVTRLMINRDMAGKGLGPATLLTEWSDHRTAPTNPMS